MSGGKRAVILHSEDNVAVVTAAVKAGETVLVTYENRFVETILAIDAIELYHKIARKALGKQESVFKYGEMIGKTEAAIAKGAHVHIHNLKGMAITNEDTGL